MVLALLQQKCSDGVPNFADLLSKDNEMSCNFTGSTSDCSDLFQGAPLSGTLIQATFVAFIVFTSLPINAMMIAGMMFNPANMDQSRHLLISMLFSNTIVSLFLSGEVFVVSIARSWVFGYWGCQVFSFVTTIGIFSRGLAGGMLAFDRFCRHFFPISYPRLESRVVFGLLVNTWLMACLIVVPFFFFKSNSFEISIPGCSFTFETFDRPVFQSSILHTFLCIALFAAIVVPYFLYFATYMKIRTLRRVNPTSQNDSSNEEQSQDTQKEVRKVTGIHFILLLIFTATFLVTLGKFFVRLYLDRNDIVIKTRLAVYVIMSTFVQSYVLADCLLFLLIDKIRISSKSVCQKISPRNRQNENEEEVESVAENGEEETKETTV